MTENVVVLGAGYAGTGTVNKLQSELEGNARLTWIADVDYHLVLHESHRVIRDPDVRSDITFPVNRIADPSTRFIQDEVTGLDVDEQTVELADGGDDVITTTFLSVSAARPPTTASPVSRSTP